MGDDAATQLLRLLADGASPLQVAAVSADPAHLELALRAARLVDTHRDRALALRALVDTARELTAATDDSTILDAIVRRARTLLGTDVAYLTLYDPRRGDTYMRATDGAVAPSFRCLRLDLGVGLGGLVAATHEAWWTEDYPNDRRFEHTATIDGGVGDEGLVAICGTPLLVEDEFVGVLFASNRSRHTFSPDEVSLLGNLATLAAVTIRQARARAATESALAELSLAHEAERRHAQEVELVAQAHDRFTQLVASGGGIDDIARALVDLLGGWVVLVDDAGLRRVACGQVPGEPVPVGEPDPLAGGALARAARDSARGVAGDGMYAVAVRARHEVLSVLVCGGQDFTALGWRIAERAGAVAALVLLSQRDMAAARQQALSDEIGELLAGTMTPIATTLMLRREGVDHHAPLCLIVLRGTDTPVSTLVRAVTRHIGGRGVVGEHAKNAVALLTGTDPGGLAADLTQRLSSLGEVTAAGFGPLSDLQRAPEAFAEASRTVDAMIALGRRGQGGAVGDLGFAGLIVGSTPDVAAYVASILGPLIDHDRDKGTALVATVEAFFAAGRSQRRAAQRLHVHVNTVVQRLERVAALLGAGWTDPEPSLEIQLALRLRSLLPATGRRRSRAGWATARRPAVGAAPERPIRRVAGE